MRCLLLILLYTQPVFSQHNQKFVEKSDGTYSYCYHKNGKISTEEFRPSSHQYMAQGYAKAFDPKGVEIYNALTSRSGQISSVWFTYYENGAVKSAEYSSHPDAGIQWYKKTTWFDESGKITSEAEYSHDDHVTLTHALPDSTLQRMEKEREERDLRAKQEQVKQEKEQFSKDSAAFYLTTTEVQDDGTTVSYISDPEHGKREQIVTRKNKIVKTTTDYFIKTQGIQSITRTYFKNGRIHEEYTYEAQIWHYREYDQKGHIVQEILNQSIVRYE